MEVIEKKSIGEIKETLESLFNENNNSSVFQSYKIISCVDTLPYHLKCKSKIKVFEVKDNNDTLLIGLFRKHGSSLTVVGSEERFDFVDFVYGDLDKKSLVDALYCLFVYLRDIKKIKEIEFRYLDFESKTYESINVIKNKYKDIDVSFSEVLNEKLAITYNDYDQYYSSLSKNTRQNIRTAYNRLKKDGYASELKIIKRNENEEQKLEIHYNCLELYKNRLKRQYNCGILALAMKKFDYVSKGIMNDFGYISALYFNNKIVAFMEGFIDVKLNSILIPRLAIDEEFKFYSPGIVLLNETIKTMYINNEFNFLNLLRGNEKYKLAMGCTEYLTVNTHIKFK